MPLALIMVLVHHFPYLTVIYFTLLKNLHCHTVSNNFSNKSRCQAKINTQLRKADLNITSVSWCIKEWHNQEKRKTVHA